MLQLELVAMIDLTVHRSQAVNFAKISLPVPDTFFDPVPRSTTSSEPSLRGTNEWCSS
jgi:hypothetical protein